MALLHGMERSLICIIYHLDKMGTRIYREALIIRVVNHTDRFNYDILAFIHWSSVRDTDFSKEGRYFIEVMRHNSV